MLLHSKPEQFNIRELYKKKHLISIALTKTQITLHACKRTLWLVLGCLEGKVLSQWSWPEGEIHVPGLELKLSPH